MRSSTTPTPTTEPRARTVRGQRAGADVFKNAKTCADQADDQSEEQDFVARDLAVEKRNLLQLRQLDVRLAGKGICAAE